MERHLDWEGCVNVRDLGGLRTRDGGRIRRGAIVRGDALDRLSAAGWAALEAHGIRTVIDLRNDDELAEDLAPRPRGLTTLHLPLDGVEDVEFWKDWHDRPEFGTPLYYRPFLDHFPQRTAAVITAIARAEPGGVAVHCGIGRDRTGLITILLLALAGADAEEIAADYALSEPRVPFGQVGTFYEDRGITPAAVIAELLAELDVEAYLRAAGVGDDDLRALRERLVSAAGRPSRPAAGTPRPAT
jgi:protein-tyrosine phosphatase